MIWLGKYAKQWRRHFALFPTSIESGTKVVWLRFYWSRYVDGPQLCDQCQLKRDSLILGYWETTSNNPFPRFTDDPDP